MKYLKIRNDGELDVRLVALMGGTTKANNKFKIGQFGTGLKYTLAWLFRNNVIFKIFVGERQVKITTKSEMIGNTNFDIIYIDGKRTSITTGMGLDWKGWMILRELWCNALDEGGQEKDIIERGLSGVAASTTFYIQITGEIQEALDKWNTHFISSEEIPIFQNDLYRLYEGSDHLCLYKNGVLILEDKSKKSVFRYDILNAHINEMREYKSAISMDVSCAIKALDSAGIEYFLSNLTTDMFEGNNMDYDWMDTWSESWRTFMLTNKLLTQNIRHRFSDNGYSYDEKDYTTVPECLYNTLTKSFEGAKDLDVKSNKFDFFHLDNEDMAAKIALCTDWLKGSDYSIDERLSFLYGFFSNKKTLIEIDKKNNRLLISIALSQSSIPDIITLLVEKNEEYAHKLDGFYEIKDHFIKLFVKKLLTKKPQAEPKAILMIESGVAPIPVDEFEEVLE